MYKDRKADVTVRSRKISHAGRTWLFRLLSILLGVFLSLVGIELLIRTLHLFSTDRLIASHPYYGVMNIPNASGWFVRGEVKQFVTINSQGLRDHEYEQKPSSDLRRFLLLGDSFISAFQVPLEKSCQVVAEQLLTTATGCSTEIIAAACNGWGTTNELAYLQREGLDLQAAGVIVALFPENDLLDNLGPKPGSVPWPPPPSRTSGILFPSFIRARIGSNRFVRTWLRDHPRLMRRMTPSSFRKEKALARGLYHLYSSSGTMLQKRMWQILEETLEQMRTLTLERGIPLGVLIVPGSLAVDDKEIVRLQNEWDILRHASLNPNGPRRGLDELLTRLSIPSIDLLPAFRAGIDAGENLLYRREGHWTAAGNHVAALCLSEFIQKEFNVAHE